MVAVRIFGAVVIIAILSRNTVAAVGEACIASSDCANDECCFNPVMYDGRRQAMTYSCQPRVAIGGYCYVNNDAALDDDATHVYMNACPCQWNARCAGSGMFEMPQGEVGTCQGIFVIG